MAIAVGFINPITDIKKGCNCLACKPETEINPDNKNYSYIDMDGHTQILKESIKDYTENASIIKFRAIRDIIQKHLLLLKADPEYYFFLLFPNMVGSIHFKDLYKTRTFRYIMSLQLGYIDYVTQKQISCDCNLCEYNAETTLSMFDIMTGHRKHIR